MRVVVTRSGGIAGLRRTWSVDVDSRSDAAWWHDLVAALPWSTPPARGGGDHFVYTVAVEDAVAPRSVTLGEAQLDDAWRALVDRVRAG